MLGFEEPDYCYLFTLNNKSFVVLYVNELKYWQKRYPYARVDKFPFRPSTNDKPL